MLGTCTLYLARSASLWEAADVLRTDRRTEIEEKITSEEEQKVAALHSATLEKASSKLNHTSDKS